MSGFRWGPPLHELRHSPGRLLEVVRGALAASESGPARLNAFLSVDLDHPTIGSGTLAGIPVALKDNLATTALPTTCGSRLLEGYRSPFDAAVVRQLRDAGAHIVGKTNLDEFAMGSSTEYSAYGPTRNPWAPDRVPGGSSGGSAAAVAAGIVPIALGTDTGGSVRQPASFCGVVGLKPTYGRISRYGMVSLASSLDHVGILGRSVDDVARVLEVLGRHDRLDATSARVPAAQVVGGLRAGVQGLTVGVPAEYFPSGLHPDVGSSCRSAIERLRSVGVRVVEVSLPNARLAVPAYQVIAAAEASTNLARFDGLRFGGRAGRGGDPPAATRARLGREVKRRILSGTLVLSSSWGASYLERARCARGRVSRDFEAVFGTGVDLLFTPTTPGPAFELGSRSDDPVRMHLSDALTVGANLAGLPAVSIPIGRSGRLPLGGQLIGPSWSEAVLLRAAAALEAEIGFSALDD